MAFRPNFQRLRHGAVAAATGGAALWLVASFVGPDFARYVVAVVVGAVVASTPWLLKVDDMIARDLESLAQKIKEAKAQRMLIVEKQQAKNVLDVLKKYGI